MKPVLQKLNAFFTDTSFGDRPPHLLDFLPDVHLAPKGVGTRIHFLIAATTHMAALIEEDAFSPRFALDSDTLKAAQGAVEQLAREALNLQMAGPRAVYGYWGLSSFQAIPEFMEGCAKYLDIRQPVSMKKAAVPKVVTLYPTLEGLSRDFVRGTHKVADGMESDKTDTIDHKRETEDFAKQVDKLLSLQLREMAKDLHDIMGVPTPDKPRGPKARILAFTPAQN